MDIQKLRYFYITAQLEHLTRASEILHISQPSLTQAIQSLEFELGVSLFERKGRKIFLTQIGKALKNRLEELLPKFDSLPKEIEQLKTSATNSVKLNILERISFPTIELFLVSTSSTHSFTARITYGRSSL